MLKGNLKSCLLYGKESPEDKALVLKDHLCSKTLQELHFVAKDLSVRLTGSSHRADIVNRMIGIAQTGVIRNDSLNEGTITFAE